MCVFVCVCVCVCVVCVCVCVCVSSHIDIQFSSIYTSALSHSARTLASIVPYTALYVYTGRRGNEEARATDSAKHDRSRTADSASELGSHVYTGGDIDTGTFA